MSFLYRKKPVVIEAVQLNDFGGEATRILPRWVMQAVMNKTLELWTDGRASIQTLEGTMIAEKDDWIIKGVKGELYACKPDIFEATYEKVPS